MPHAPMHNPHGHDMVISRTALTIAVSMAAFALVVATASVFFGLKTDVLKGTPVIAERVLTFEEFPGGVVRIQDPETQANVALLEEDESGFVRNVLRGFAYQRRLQNVPATEPYRLERYDHRRIAMVDVATGVRYNLYGHGQRNMAAFQPLVPTE